VNLLYEQPDSAAARDATPKTTTSRGPDNLNMEDSCR
jgi:hypothetical protein